MESIHVVAGDGEQRSAIQAGFDLARDGGQLLKGQESISHNSTKVFLHSFDSCLPESTHVWRSGRDVVPCEIVVGGEIVLYLPIVLLGL